MALLVGVVAAGVVLLTTREGVGTTVDSGEYLAVADGLRHGHGLTMPYLSYDEPYPDKVVPGERVDMTQYPPLLPAAVATVEATTGSSPVVAVRWVNAIALGAVAALVAALVGRATRSLGTAGLAGGLVVAPTFVYAASMAWSEPLMLVTFLASLGALTTYLQNRDRRWLWGAVAMAALCSMTRFTGLAAVLAIAIVVFLTSRPPMPRRVGHAVAVLACGTAPEVLWFARNTVLMGAPSDKHLAWHPPGGPGVKRVARTLTSWFIQDTPDRRVWVGGILAVALLLAAVAAARAIRRATVDWSSLPAVCAVFAVVYAVFMLAAQTTYDRNIDLSTRHLLAVQLLLIVGVLAGVGARHRVARRIVLGAACLLLASGVARLAGSTIPHFPDTYRSGYASRAWDHSQGIPATAALPAGTLVATNAPDAVWLRTGRPTLFLPLTVDLYAGGRNRHYDQELAALRAAMTGHEAVVVFFDRPTRGGRHAIDRRAVAALGLVPTARLRDATVFAVGG